MKPLYLLDTDVILDLLKNKDNPSLFENICARKDFCVISVFSWYECLSIVNSLENDATKDSLLSFLIDKIQTYFEILPYNNHAAWLQVDIEGKLTERGVKVNKTKLQIASMALAENLILVSKNPEMYDEIKNVSSVIVENWD